MPPKGEEPLTPEELALLKLWIDQGAKAPAMRRERPKVIVSGPPANVHPVLGVAIRPDKKEVAASRGNQIHIYEAASGKHLRTLIDPQLTTPDKKPIKAAHLSIVESLAYSPDGKTLASGAFQEVVLWDADKGTIRQRLTGFADRVVALDFSHDGKLLATGGGAPTADGEIKIFDVASGKLVVDIKNGHSDTVFGVSFSPDDKKLATCAADKFVKTFEVPSGKFLKSFEGHTHHVLGVGWKADGKLLASAGADNVIKIWDFDKGEQAPHHQRPRQAGHAPAVHRQDRSVRHVQRRSDGALLEHQRRQHAQFRRQHRFPLCSERQPGRRSRRRRRTGRHRPRLQRHERAVAQIAAAAGRSTSHGGKEIIMANGRCQVAGGVCTSHLTPAVRPKKACHDF